MTSQPREKKTKVDGERRKEKTNTEKKNLRFPNLNMCIKNQIKQKKQKRSVEKGVSVHQLEPNVKNKIIKILPLSRKNSLT